MTVSLEKKQLNHEKTKAEMLAVLKAVLPNGFKVFEREDQLEKDGFLTQKDFPKFEIFLKKPLLRVWVEHIETKHHEIVQTSINNNQHLLGFYLNTTVLSKESVAVYLLERAVEGRQRYCEKVLAYSALARTLPESGFRELFFAFHSGVSESWTFLTMHYKSCRVACNLCKQFNRNRGWCNHYDVDVISKRIKTDKDLNVTVSSCEYRESVIASKKTKEQEC